MGTFLKKPVNVNFILILAVVILLAGLALASGIFAAGVGNEASAIGSQIEDMRAGEIDDVTGSGILLLGAVSSPVILVSAFGWILAVVLFMMALFLFIPLVTARLLYRDTGGRLLAYRIIMGITYVLLLPLPLLLFSLVGQSVPVTVSAVLGALLVLAVIVVNVINTYSDRIKI